MSVPTNTYQTYQTVGIREDLENVIYNISPTETPFFSALGQGKATQTYHEWITDSLASPAQNAQIEGDDATADASTPGVRLGNYTQISRKVASLSDTDQEVLAAGAVNTMEYQIAKRGLELRRDMETIMIGTNTARSAGNATTARYLGSILSWVATNQSVGSGGAAPTGNGTDTRTDGTQRAFTEAQLKTVLQAVWTQGGKPNCIMTGAFNKQALSGFTGNATRFVQAESETLQAAIDFYQSDFGELQVIPNRFQRARDVWVLDTQYWAMASLRSLKAVPLSKTGDSERQMLVVEYTLVSRQEKASGIVADLTTS
jgi:hypothetical protein